MNHYAETVKASETVTEYHYAGECIARVVGEATPFEDIDDTAHEGNRTPLSVAVMQDRIDRAFLGLDVEHRADHTDVTLPDGSGVRVEDNGRGIDIYAADSAHDTSVVRKGFSLRQLDRVGASVRRAAAAGDMTAREVVAQF